MKNDELDKRVLEAIRSGIRRAAKIEAATGTDVRSVGKSLQRLRRKGKIAFNSPVGWVAIDSAGRAPEAKEGA